MSTVTGINVGDAVQLARPGSMTRGVVQAIMPSGAVRVHWLVHGKADFIYRASELAPAEHDPQGSIVVQIALF